MKPLNEKILEILYNVIHWETCPEDYKKIIEDFLKNTQKIHTDDDMLKEYYKGCKDGKNSTKIKQKTL